MKFTSDKDDLKKDEVYRCTYNGNHYLFKPINDGAQNCNYIKIIGNQATDRGTSGGFGSLISKSNITQLSMATAEEKNWLNTCINLKKLISKPKVGIEYEVY